MSKYILDITCPECDSEDVKATYSERLDEIICECEDCGYRRKLKGFYYSIEEDDRQ